MAQDDDTREALRRRREEAMRRADEAMARRRAAQPAPVSVRAPLWERLRRWWRARRAER